MLRTGLLCALVVIGLTGCVTDYNYRAGQDGDYYYSEPSVDYYGDGYGSPYGSIGYGSGGGWYGSFGYQFGFGRHGHGYSQYGYPYWYGGYGAGYYPYYQSPYDQSPYYRSRNNHRPPPWRGLPPQGGVPGGNQPRPGNGRGPNVDNRDRESGPWRRLGDLRPGHPPGPPQITRPEEQQGAQPLLRPRASREGGREDRPRFSQSQPGVGGSSSGTYQEPRRQERPRPEPRTETHVEPRPPPAMPRQVEMQERESGREPTP